MNPLRTKSTTIRATTTRIVNLSKYTTAKKDRVVCYGLDGQPLDIYVAPELDEWNIVAVRPNGAVEPKVNDSDDDDDSDDCVPVSSVGTLNVCIGPPTGLPGGSGGPEQEEDDHRHIIEEFIANSFGTGEDDGVTVSAGSLIVL